MQYFAWRVIATLVNTFLIINIVDILLMGSFRFKFSKKSRKSAYMVTKENCIDIQEGNSCSGYAIAYLLRHYGISVNGDEIYAKLKHTKIKDGCILFRWWDTMKTAFL